MSYETVAKIDYNAEQESLTIYSCSSDAEFRDYACGRVILADSDIWTPDYAVTPFEKLMFVLLETSMLQSYHFKATVAAKYRHAYNVTKATIIANGDDEYTDYDKEEYFRLFIDVINGDKKPTAGKFVVGTEQGEGVWDMFYKSSAKDTFLTSSAKVFKTKEEAYVVSKSASPRALVMVQV